MIGATCRRGCGFLSLGSAPLLLLLATLPMADRASADPLPPSPAAVKSGARNASEYWDLTIETEAGYHITSRFLITNEGPGSRNAIAVGHVVAADGRSRRFRNGRLKKDWDLSPDGLRLDIGKSHLHLDDGRAHLLVEKNSVALNVSFPMNALRSVPREVSGTEDYRIDLLAIGADAGGTIRLKGMGAPLEVRGLASLTHTMSERRESSQVLRKIEMMGFGSDASLYLLDYTPADGEQTRWLAHLDRSCDPGTVPIGTCTPMLRSRSDFELVLEENPEVADSAGEQDSYWIPHGLSLVWATTLGQITLGEAFLRHDPLDDLPRALRFLASFTTAPRREWSAATFEVTIPPTSESAEIQFQGKGVGSIGYLNPLTRPRVR